MRQFLVRMAWGTLLFACVYGAHALIHAEHGFFGGVLGGVGFMVGESMIRRPE